MDERWFRELISEKKEGLPYNLLRGLLRIASKLYFIGNMLRNKTFALGLRKSNKADKPVISIGNITTGGTGKTPLVIWVCNYLIGKGLIPAVLTRGYKTGKGKLTDEPAILAKGCGGAKVIVNSNRFEGARKAVNEYGCDVMVMDDGFQHRQLFRNLDIVVVDATCPFGYNRLLPAGLLREPLGAMKRADAFIISRCDQVTVDRLEEIQAVLRKIKPDCITAHARHYPKEAVMLKNAKLSVEELKEKKVFAFCGIGNPQAFLKTLENLKLDVTGYKIYNDHHNYNIVDLQDVYEQARYFEADIILTTQKDWVKTALLSLNEDDIDFAYLAIDMDFVTNQDKIEELIDKAIEKF